MKKTSILSLLGLAGLLAFLATPTFAQEVGDDVVAEAENVLTDDAAVAEDATVDSSVYEQNYGDEEDAVADDALSDLQETIAADPQLVSDLNEGMDNFLDALEISEEGRAEFESQFENPEERALVTAIVGFLFAGAGIIYLVIACIWTIICIIALWKVFTKAGEKGWKSIIPIYNVYISFKIVGMKNWFWWMLLGAFVVCLIGAFIPEYEKITTGIASIYAGIISIVAAFKLPRKFGWGVFTSILYVLFPEICLLFLGFGGSKYQGKKD